MKVRVSYVDFHWDNHQGGSGKSFEMSVVIDIPELMPASEIKELIADSVKSTAAKNRPFGQWQHEIPIITKIEIL